jgi:hypothetical protein
MVTVVVAMTLGTLAVLLYSTRRWRTPLLPAVETLPGHEPLDLLTAELRDAFGAERIAVIAADPDRAGEWRVAACTGAPGLLGSRLPIAARRTSRTIGPEEASALGLPGDGWWTYAHVPLTGVTGTAGAVMVATRRRLPFSPAELTLIERLARTRAPEFERRRQARVA